MAELFDNGLKYSALNTARSALSSFVLLSTGQSFGSHHLVIRFLRAVYNDRPSLPRYKEIWNVDVVLNLLRKWSPVKYLSLKQLTYKLVMLCALVASARAQTLSFLSLDNMDIHTNKYIFKIPQLLKQSRPGYENPDVVIKAYPVDRRLCVLTVLKEYLKRTKSIRATKQLFVSFIKPHDKVTTSTIGRWVRTVMQKAGINTTKYKAHSVRAAVASKASSNVPINDIMKLAGWSQESTFRKYYKKNITSEVDTASAILN